MFSNQPIRIALAATVSEFLSIRCVEAVERALSEPLAGERSDFLPVVVARFAEVMRAEAEPPRGLAAVPALVHDEVGTVLGAASHTDLHTVLLAEAADIVLRLSLVRLFLHFLSFLYFFVGLLLCDTSCTVPHTTVVRQLALVALVVFKLKESKLFKLVVEFFSLLSDTFTLVEPFNDCLMLNTILDHPMHPGPLLNDVVSVRGQVFFLSHLLVAGRAVNIVAVDSFRGVPLALHLRVEALRVKDVFAAELHAGTVPHSLGVAECAEVIQSHSEGARLVFLQTVIVEAGHALCLTLETIAGVTAGIHLLAHRVAELDTGFVSADVFEGGDSWVQRGLGHHLLAEPALF